MAHHKLMSEYKRRICELDAESIAYYRRNPCIACEDLLGIKLIDSQKYILQASWNKPHVLWCCSRNFGKSFLGAVFMILKAILYENQAIYIISSVGNQAKETFSKIEEIVLRIGKTSASIRSLKDIVEKETTKTPNNKTGFSHGTAGFIVEFYNGSTIETLNSKPDNARSKHIKIILLYRINPKRRKFIIKQKRWTSEDVEYLKENHGVLSNLEIANFLGRTEGSVAAKAHDLKITNNKEWTNNEINYLINNYLTKTNKQLAIDLKRTKAAIDLKINRLGLVKSPYSYNHDFFETIDTEEKAYWLGFIYADGCVYQNFNNRVYELSIKLCEGDYIHLKKFNKSIEGNLPVVFLESICSFNNKPQKSCSIRCHSRKMTDDLISHGCIQNKTFYIEIPNIPEPLMNHFIRGFFDGDGCICTDNKKKRTVAINFCSASEKFLIQLREHLFKYNICSYIIDEKNKSTYRLYIKGIKNVDKMWNYMFENATVFLDRKYIKKQELYKKYELAQRLLR